MRGDGYLFQRRGYWWVGIRISGRFIQRSCRTKDIDEARRQLSEWTLKKRDPVKHREFVAAREGQILEQTARALSGGGTVTLRGEQFLAARRPLVYAWVRGGEALYVGMSTVGLGRPLSRTHEQLHAFLKTDSLRIWPCADAKVAAALERRLIRRLHPPFNRAGNGSVLVSTRKGITAIDRDPE